MPSTYENIREKTIKYITIKTKPIGNPIFAHSRLVILIIPVEITFEIFPGINIPLF